MASIKVAKDCLLIGDEDEGPRKVIQTGTRRAAKTPEPSLTLRPPPPPSRQPRVIPKLATVDVVPVNAAGANPDDQCSPDEEKTETVTSACNVVGGAKPETKQCAVSSEELQKGHSYRVKYLGEYLVEQPKGTEMVKDAVRKMQFNKHIKRAEGQKSPKLDLIISTDGITIQDPRSKRTMNQYPLHRISFCAEDKSDRELFTFIARERDGNKYYCYIFKSGKVAAEMALKVGQAFDTAYRRFLDAGSGASDTDYKEKWIELQQMVHQLQVENEALKRRVEELGKIKDCCELEQYMKTYQLSSLSSVSSIIFNKATSEDAEARREEDDDSDEDGVINIKENQSSAQDQPLAGRPLEDLIFDLPTLQTSAGYSVSSQPLNSADLLTQNANIEDVWGTGRSVMEQHSKTALPAQTAPNVISAGEIWGTGLSITKQQPATPLPTQTIANVTSNGNIWGTGQLSAIHQPTQTASNVMKAVNTWGTGQSVTAKASGYNTSLNPFAAPAKINIPAVSDPFGLGIFSPTSVNHGLPLPQEKLFSTQAGFGQGLFQVTGKCSFDDIDPLNRLL